MCDNIFLINSDSCDYFLVAVDYLLSVLKLENEKTWLALILQINNCEKQKKLNHDYRVKYVMTSGILLLV